MKPKPVAIFIDADSAEDTLDMTTADNVVDRLEAVRSYLGSLIDHIESDDDPEVNEAIAEALASIDQAAAGAGSRD